MQHNLSNIHNLISSLTAHWIKCFSHTPAYEWEYSSKKQYIFWIFTYLLQQTIFNLLRAKTWEERHQWMCKTADHHKEHHEFTNASKMHTPPCVLSTPAHLWIASCCGYSLHCSSLHSSMTTGAGPPLSQCRGICSPCLSHSLQPFTSWSLNTVTVASQQILLH